ncbi:maleylpyruvate isomerase family mycothiol-dependent enzyme [Nocardioides sp. LHD-245]|uniref:maleylpyruvate isomerase family mycothiol-dependent enzyme n=1 Tax=Nocardioides sp. LHD-245 TaxID=3051387 RepID=UPI0027DED04D|nr:maleylpyruvate isomerase family mycothiol-dependent enzyme [Nocardioides sp. LHD-245]
MTPAVEGALRTASTAYRRFADRCRGVEPTLPTRLSGWTVADLVEHVAWGAAMEAAALRTAAGLPASAPERPDLARAIAAFERAADLEVAPTAPVALPAGTVPLAYAAPLFAFEAALHAADLEHALSRRDRPLGAPELEACSVVVGPMLDLLAATVPEEDAVIDLVGLGDGIRLSATGGSWHRGEPDGRAATTTVAGTAHEVIMFVAGRIDATRLDVRGRAEHARRFKTYFPGP